MDHQTANLHHEEARKWKRRGRRRSAQSDETSPAHWRQPTLKSYDNRADYAESNVILPTHAVPDQTRQREAELRLKAYGELTALTTHRYHGSSSSSSSYQLHQSSRRVRTQHMIHSTVDRMTQLYRPKANSYPSSSCHPDAMGARCKCSPYHRQTTKTSMLSCQIMFIIAFASILVPLMNLNHLTAPVIGALANSVVVTQSSTAQQSNSVIQMPTTGTNLAPASSATFGTTPTATANSMYATHPSSKSGRYKTLYACEDRQLTMDCEFGSKINLIRANFGRFSIQQCNEQGSLDLSTDCMSPITFRIMQERCQDKQKCSVNATSLIFGDRCPKTRKYLEVHFQCQPDPRSIGMSPYSISPQDVPEKVDVRNLTQTPSGPLPPNTIYTPSSPILPPNNPAPSPHNNHHLHHPQSHQNPFNNAGRQPFIAPPIFQSSDEIAIGPNKSPTYQPTNQQHQQTMAVINSEILSSNHANNNVNDLRYQDPLASLPIIVTLPHKYIENMSNPRCHQWDQAASPPQWTERGAHLIETNSTHTICAFDQATSYLLVMNHSTPNNQMISATNSNLNQNHPQPAIVPQFATHQPQMTPIGPPIPNMLDLQPVVFDSINNQPAVSSKQQQSTMARFISLFGYLLGGIFVVVLIFTTFILFVTTMRSTATAAFKSLGNFTPFGGPNYKSNGRRQDLGAGVNGSSSLHPSKDLLVINNQNGHQFLYAPASTTKISSSSSTHILSATGHLNGQTTLGQLHHQHNHLGQQPIYSGTTLGSSAGGGQSNNYYYGLMGLNSLFQHQQHHHLSQHHLNQQQQQPQVNFNHQANNKSNISSESTPNSSASSSGIESGSASVQQNNTGQGQQAACLVTMNNDYNLLNQQQLSNYGHHVGGGVRQQQQQQQQYELSSGGALTLNAHYSGSNNGCGGELAGTGQLQFAGILHGRHFSAAAMRDHIYECVDDEKPYMARLLMPSSDQQGQQFSTLGHHQHFQQQQQQLQLAANARNMTLSSRLLQDAMQQPQHEKRQQHHQQQQQQQPFLQPQIVRDHQAGKTNIVCSKLAQVTPQRATEINGKTFHQDVMAIYNGSDATTASSSVPATSAAGSFAPSGVLGDTLASGKVSTDC